LDTNPASEIPKKSTFNYHSMQRTLTALYYDCVLDRIVMDPPVWLINQHIEMNGAWGASSLLQMRAFHDYCLAMFDAGYYGITQVNMKGEGPNKGTDHWVLMRGMRQRQEGNNIIEEINIGDSALSMPQERWVGFRSWLRDCGGFMAMFARPCT